MQMKELGQYFPALQLSRPRFHSVRVGHSAAGQNQTPPAVSGANEPVTDVRAAAPTQSPPTARQAPLGRHSRRHVQQYLRHLDRIVRHAIHRELKAAEEMDEETRIRIKELAKEFRQGLRDTFLTSGRGREFDPAAILAGLSTAIAGLTDGLRALRGEPTADELMAGENAVDESAADGSAVAAGQNADLAGPAATDQAEFAVVEGNEPTTADPKAAASVVPDATTPAGPKEPAVLPYTPVGEPPLKITSVLSLQA